MGTLDLPASVVGYLPGLLHEGKCHVSERQLRSILRLRTGELQVMAFEELRNGPR